jgi:hypothetical protein
MLAAAQPYPQYFDLDGSPLDGGAIYYGTANADPESSPLTVYWDAAGTTPAAQPIPTLNGFPVRAGTPAAVYVSGDYSLRTRNRLGETVLYCESAATASQLLSTQLDLASDADGKGASLVGFDYSLNYAARTLGWAAQQGHVQAEWFRQTGYTDTQTIAAALAYCQANQRALAVGRVYSITATQQAYAGLRIVGTKSAQQVSAGFKAIGGINIFTCGPGFASESMCFENLLFDSDTPGQGAAFYGDATSYLSQTTFRNCTWYSNLRFGINGPIIVCSFYDCDFGTYPGAVQNFTAINAAGTLGSYEPNANTFHKCLFRKSSATSQIIIEAGGSQWNFYGCVFEANANTWGVISGAGAGAVSFYGGYIENNGAPYFVRAGGDLATAFHQIVRFHGAHLNGPATTALIARAIAYPLLDIQGCYGAIACALISNESGLLNQPADIEMCLGNHLVMRPGGSVGSLDIATGSGGYNTRRWRALSVTGDTGDFSVLNGVQKLGVSVIAATPIAQLSNPLGGGNWSGLIQVAAMSGSTLDAAGAVNTASYLLHVSNGGVTVCTQVSGVGVTGGAAADQPSFTWGINGLGQLVATPVGSTSGVFSFLVSAMGGVRAA